MKTSTRQQRRGAQSMFDSIIGIQIQINRLLICQRQSLAIAGCDWIEHLKKRERILINRIFVRDKKSNRLVHSNKVIMSRVSTK
jgi:hypothetical protein